jgi:hypothetical protein
MDSAAQRAGGARSFKGLPVKRRFAWSDVVQLRDESADATINFTDLYTGLYRIFSLSKGLQAPDTIRSTDTDIIPDFARGYGAT